MKAVELTEISWILYDNNEVPTALIVKRIKEYILIKKDGQKSFANLEALYTEVGEPFNFKKRPDKLTMVKIGNLPVDADEVFNVEEENIVSYTKSEKSKIRFAAGYWGLLYSTQYVDAFCPKVSTVEKYKHIGPFEERLILQSELLLANKRLNDESQDQT